TNIQVAVDAAVAGDEIVVTNGIYATGGRGRTVGTRVTVDKPLRVRSINGPGLTIIDGAGRWGCASVASGASLSGFTLANGFGGVYGATDAVVSNCVIRDNHISVFIQVGVIVNTASG